MRERNQHQIFSQNFTQNLNCYFQKKTLWTDINPTSILNIKLITTESDKAPNIIQLILFTNFRTSTVKRITEISMNCSKPLKNDTNRIKINFLHLTLPVY